MIDCKKFSSWRRLVRVSAYVLRFISNLYIQLDINNKAESTEDNAKAYEGPLTPRTTESRDLFGLRLARKTFMTASRKETYRS